MDTKKILEDLRKTVFAPSYFNALEAAYAARVADCPFETIEGDFSEAEPHLEKHLSHEQKATLADVEAKYRENRTYAGEYPFYCGIMCAFEQFFVPDMPPRFDYRSAVQEDLCTMPSMKRHIEFYERNTQLLELSQALMDEVDKDTREHVISIACGWDQRIHSNTIYAFYLGYRAGLSIMDRVKPMSSFELTSKKLYLEYELGFTTPYEFREKKVAKKEVS